MESENNIVKESVVHQREELHLGIASGHGGFERVEMVD